MPHFYRTLAFLLILPGLWACRRDSPEPDTGVRQRVFTAGREITDEQVKKRFIQQAGTPFTVPVGVPGPDDVVRFIHPDTVMFGTSTIPFVVATAGQQYLCYSPLQVRVATANDIFRSLLKYTSPLVAVPTATGFAYLTKEVRVGYADGNGMRIARLNYRLKQTLGSAGYQEYSGLLFNEFNEASIARIRSGDTLAVQETSMVLPIR